MTTFDEREKSFEKRFAMDQDLRFKAEQRRNKLLGDWAAKKLGMSGAAVDDYIKAVRKADLKGVAMTDAELRKAIVDFLAAAVTQIETEAKTK
jgi:hypothetical protein